MKSSSWKPKHHYPENCVCCWKMGAISRGYAYAVIKEVHYPMCYKHTQALLGVGKPEAGESYPLEDLTSLGPTGSMPHKKPMYIVVKI